MKSHQPISPALREWILTTTRAGHDVKDVLRLMHENGYEAQQSKRIVATVLNMPLAALDVRVHKPKGGVRSKHPQAPNRVIGDHTINVSLSVNAPPLRVLDGLLCADECAELIELSRSRLDRALVMNPEGKPEVDHRRTSEGMFFTIGEVPLVKALEDRIATLLGVPVEHGEGLQILHYLPGQQYEPHQDWFDPQWPGYATTTAKGGQRVASLIMYLNTPEAGGGTDFPHLGLTVTALRGSAVYFAYETGDEASLHAGMPVLKGEKWIATKWLRERPYQK